MAQKISVAVFITSSTESNNSFKIANERTTVLYHSTTQSCPDLEDQDQEMEWLPSQTTSVPPSNHTTAEEVPMEID